MTLPKHIYNSHYGNGVPAMFTYQLDNTKRKKLLAHHCCNGSCRYIWAGSQINPCFQNKNSGFRFTGGFVSAYFRTHKLRLWVSQFCRKIEPKALRKKRGPIQTIFQDTSALHSVPDYLHSFRTWVNLFFKNIRNTQKKKGTHNLSSHCRGRFI